MELPEEIRQAAQVLGDCLRANLTVQDFLTLKSKAETDPEVIDLETRLESIFTQLISREQNGESIEREDVEPYHALRAQVRFHPLISARDDQLNAVKPVFAKINYDMSDKLGIDYQAFVALSEE